MTGPELDTYLSTDEMPDNAAQLATVLRQGKFYASRCERNSRVLLPYVGTQNAARTRRAAVRRRPGRGVPDRVRLVRRVVPRAFRLPAGAGCRWSARGPDRSGQFPAVVAGARLRPGGERRPAAERGGGRAIQQVDLAGPEGRAGQCVQR